MRPAVLCRGAAAAFTCVLAVLAILKYPGQPLVYLFFTLVSSALLYFGFRRNAIFFDTFIGIFFWLGFWLKLSVRVAFFDGRFSQAVGRFDGSAAAFDHALLVSSCGFLALLAASLAREKYLFSYPARAGEATQQGLLAFYREHRIAVLAGFVALSIGVAATNAYFGIYQRGMIPHTVLPFGLGAVYTWLLLFGLASVAALLLHLELAVRKGAPYSVALLALVEGFLGNVSMLSRGMVLNSFSLGYGLLQRLNTTGIRAGVRFWSMALVVFCALFAASVFTVNSARHILDDARSVSAAPPDQGERRDKIVEMVLDRWVGIEGVMAVSSHPALGWQLWSDAWRETYARKMSFFDANLIASPYRDKDFTKVHYISLPGLLAFLFYPGSYSFLFVSLFALGLLAAAIEMSVFALGGHNLILCALLAQVVASRYAHFGYAPAHSYLLFAALYFNLFLIYLADKALAGRAARPVLPRP